MGEKETNKSELRSDVSADKMNKNGENLYFKLFIIPE